MTETEAGTPLGEGRESRAKRIGEGERGADTTLGYLWITIVITALE